MFLLTPRTRAMTSLVISACAFAPSHAYTCGEGSVLLAPLGALAAVPALQVAAATRVARPGYDGAGYSLEELVMFYDYPQLAGRPLLTFGEPTPTRPARISARSTTPARLGVSTARPGRATLAAPAFDSGCLTDDLVANAPPKDSRKEGGQNSYTHAYAAAA